MPISFPLQARSGVSRKPALGGVVLLAAALVNNAAAAAPSDPSQPGQVSVPTEMPESREFATALNWLNRIDPNRTPHREKQVLEGAFRGLVPPRQRRSGLEPRLTLALDFNDNLFLAAEPLFPIPDLDEPDTVRTVAIAPGLSYKNAGDRWSLLADYSFEAADYEDNDNLNEVLDAQLGSLEGSFLLSPQTVLGFFNQYRENRDAEGQLLLIPNPNLTRFEANQLVVYGSHSFSPVVSAEFIYRNQVQNTDEPTSSDIRMNEGVASLRIKTSRRDQATLRLGERNFDFSPGVDHEVQSATLGFEHEFSERFIASVTGGLLRSTTGNGEDFLKASGQLQYSTKRSITTLNATRDITTTPGFDALLLENSINASFRYRLGAGIRAGMDVSFAKFDTLGGRALIIDSVEVTPTLSFAINTGGWLVLRYGYREQSIDRGPTITNNRLTLGFVKTFH